MSFVNLTAIIAKIIDSKKIVAKYYCKIKILLYTATKERKILNFQKH